MTEEILNRLKEILSKYQSYVMFGSEYDQGHVQGQKDLAAYVLAYLDNWTNKHD